MRAPNLGWGWFAQGERLILDQLTSCTDNDRDELVGNKWLLEKQPGQAVSEEAGSAAEDCVGGDGGEVQTCVEGKLGQKP